MSFLRRLLGGTTPPAESTTPPGAPGPSSGEVAPPDELDEAGRERALLREEARRLDDELLQRQLRWADRAWVPPPQGGELRADDRDRRSDGA